MFPMSDQAFYQMLLKTYNAVKSLTSSFSDDESIIMTIYITGNEKPRIEIGIQDTYLSVTSKVEGKEISEITREYLRRKGFALQQKNLLLAPPVVEHEEPDDFIPTFDPPAVLDDEIPF